jgi:Flp pilus assembly protein CpaB
MAPVVVAAGPIAPRTVITGDMIRVQQLPAEAIHPSALRSPSDAIGKVARIAMTGDEQLLTTKLYLQNDQSGLAFMVPEGMRAVSVGVSEVIVPGDRVDVIGVFEIKVPTPTGAKAANEAAGPPITQQDKQAMLSPGAAGQGDPQTTFVATNVLEDVSVLAIAQQLEGQDTRDNTQRLAQSTGMAGNTKPGQQQLRSDPQALPAAKTATLAVNPDDALKLVLAESHGQIRLALRRGLDSPSSPQLAKAPMTALSQPGSR